MPGQEVVLITGCATGIGRALAIALSQRKSAGGKALFKVYATDNKVTALEGLRSYGISTLELDVTSDDSVKQAVDKVLVDGDIDLLICNAGIHCAGFLTEIEYTDVEKTFDVNVHGTFRLVQAVGPHMMARRKGKIATMCDTNSWFARPFYGPYEAISQASTGKVKSGYLQGSKAALALMSEGLHVEMRAFNVVVTSICTGWVRTDFLKNGLTDFSRYEKSDSYYNSAVGYFRQLFNKFASLGPSAEAVAEEITDKLLKKEADAFLPGNRFIYTGANVWSTLWRGFFQQWMFHGVFARYLASAGGLYKAARLSVPVVGQKVQ